MCTIQITNLFRGIYEKALEEDGRCTCGSGPRGLGGFRETT